VSYSLWLDPEEETDEGDPIVLGILRTERWAIDPAETAEDVAEGEDLIYERHDLWAPELGYLEFRYFDGIAWSTTWNVTEGNRLPHLIQITVGFDSLTRDDNEDIDLDEFPIEEFPLGPEVPNINRFSTLVRVPAADEMYWARLNKIGDEVEEQFTSGLPDEEESEGEGS